MSRVEIDRVEIGRVEIDRVEIDRVENNRVEIERSMLNNTLPTSAYAYTSPSQPPKHDPASPQSMTFWTESRVGPGNLVAALCSIVHLSVIALVAPCAQHEPQ